MPIRFQFCVVLLALFSSCSEQRHAAGLLFQDQQDRTSVFDPDLQLRLLRMNEASADADLAFARHDYRFVALSGMVIDVPGFANRADVRTSLKIKVIAGTGGTHEEYERLSEQYALGYNLRMLSLLQGAH